MRASRKCGPAFARRAFRRALLALCASALAIAGFAVIPAAAASASVAAPGTPAASAAPAVAASVCSTPPNDGEVFIRCTGSTWADTSCAQNQNYNGANGPFNVVSAHNGCFVRVWLHQNAWNGTNWGTGWTVCVPPGAFNKSIALQNQHPLNIYVSTNQDNC